MTAQAINENASGYFMVASNALPKSWELAKVEATAKVFGKGLWNTEDIEPSCPNCDSEDPAERCPDCPPGGPGSGGTGGHGGGHGGSGGSGGGSGCRSGMCGPVKGAMAGMPYWEVQEPYISLWLRDRPMFYNMSYGREFGLKLGYHQRETRPADAGIFNFGPWWSCNWFNYIKVEGTVRYGYEEYPCLNTNTWEWETCVGLVTSGSFEGTQYAPGGGTRKFSWGGTNNSHLIDARSLNELGNTQSTTAFTNTYGGIDYAGTNYHFQAGTMSYPNGSEAVFGLVVVKSLYPEERIAFLTSISDPQGRQMRYYYSTNTGQVLLTHVIDFDGRTNQLVYGNTNFPTSVTAITNTAYSLGVSFGYNTNGFLTNIVDAIRLTNSFQYTYTKDLFYTHRDEVGEPIQYEDGNPVPPTTNWVWLLTKMTTPYGDTSFDYFHPTWRLYTPPGINVDSQINRAITVTQPDGGKQLFMYQDMGNSASSSPGNFPGGCGSGDDLYANNQWFGERVSQTHQWNNNSFHWGPRQYAALSTTVITNLIAQDYVMARTRNWLHASEPAYLVLAPSQTLNAEQTYGSNPAEYAYGQTIWYGYEGKPYEYIESTNSHFPATIGYRTGIAGDYRVENIWRNAKGKPTTRVEFGAEAYCLSSFVKTNLYTYAANGIDLVKHIGPDGTVLASYAYNTNHQPLFLTNALNEVTAYTYDTNHLLTSFSRPTGLITTNVYDASGFLMKTYDYEIISGTPVYYRTNSYTYTNGLVYTHTDERGLTVTNTWDKLQRLTKVAYPDDSFIGYTYDRLDLVRVTDRMGFTDAYAYDAMQRRIFETNVLGRVTSYDYCVCGSLDSVRDAAGNYTHFYYDTAGRLTNTVTADGFGRTNRYNLANQINETQDSSGYLVRSRYDPEGNLAVVDTAIDGYYRRLANYSYDTYDRVITNRNADGVTTSMTYNALGQLLTRAYANGGVERFGYSSRGIVAHTNQLNYTNFYAYDALHHKTFETNANFEITQFTYNSAGDLLTLTDGKNQITRWEYDLFGRVTNKVDAANNVLFVYKYDFNNRLTNRWSAAKSNTVYRYDAAGNLTNVDYAASTDIHFRYDALNRMTNMIDGVGTNRYGYDAVGQLLTDDGPWNSDTMSYSYTNRLLWKLSAAAPNASDWVQTYSYDGGRRLNHVTSPAGEFGFEYVFRELDYEPYYGAYVYSGGKNVTRLTMPSGGAITNDFDGSGRLLETTLIKSDYSILNQHLYGYNTGNQRTQQVFTAGNYVNYGYDKIGQLAAARGWEAGGATNRWQEQFGYVYDAAGNLSYRTNHTLVQRFNVNNLNALTTVTNGGRLTVAGSTFGPATNVTVNTSNTFLYVDGLFASTNHAWVNGNNTYTAIAKDSYGRLDTNAVAVSLAGTNNYAYDLNGNLLSDGKRGFEYDDENQLIRVTATNAWKSEFVYDGKMRRRIRKEYTWSGSWQLASETRYVYDGNLVIQERDGNNIPQATYTRGNDLSGSLEGVGGIGGLLARTSNSQLISPNFSSSAHAYFHADGNGNVTMLIYTNQTVAAQYVYDPYGNVLGMSGALAEANLYRFSSKEYHPNSGLAYYLYRYYELNLQRWINRDPISEKGGVNLYVYVLNSPIRWIDAFGLAPKVGYPAWPGNTIVCDGSGGIAIQTQTGAQMAQPPGLYECMMAHEETHRQQVLARNPSICLGVPAGRAIIDDDKISRGRSEGEAYSVEEGCLRSLEETCPANQAKIDQRIDDIRKDRERKRDRNDKDRRIYW